MENSHQLQAARPMYLEKLSWKGFVLVYLAFLVLFAISVIIGFAAGPSVYTSWEKSTPGDGSYPDMSNNNTFFKWRIDGLDRFNQQLWLTAVIENKLEGVGSVDFAMTLQTKFEASNTADDKDWVQLIWTSGNSARSTRFIRCDESSSTCTPLQIIHEPFLKYTYYRASVAFANINEAPDFVGSVKFIWTVINHKYTFFEMWFRLFFLAVSFLYLGVFCFRLRDRHYHKEWTLEQRWMLILLFGLLGFNNPTFPIQLAVASWVGDFLDSLLTSAFVAILFMFWLCYFDGITKTAIKRKFMTFYAPKYALVITLWVAFVVVFTMQQLHQNDNPTYTYVYDNPAFTAFLVIAIIVTLVYAFWFSFLLFRAFNHNQKLPLLRAQLNFIFALTFLVAVVLIFGLVIGFVGVVNNSAAQWLSMYSLLNCYVWSIAFVWGPTGEDHSSPSIAGDATMGNMMRLEEEEDDVRPSAPRPSSTSTGASAPGGARRGDFSDSEEDLPKEARSGRGSLPSAAKTRT